MILVRSVAMKISSVVVRYASSGCKEWAEGVAREVEFIEDDWAALRWAIGSTRVLFDRREAPINSLADVADMGRRLSERVSKESSGYAFMLIWAFLYLLKLLDARSWQQRIGCGLVIVAAIYMWGVVRAQWRKREGLRSDNTELTLYCRLELERQRDFLKSSLGRSLHFALILYFVGIVFAQKGGVRANPVFTAFFALGCVLVTFLWLRRTRQVQRQIDEVDAVLKEIR
jgi:hypothetical protein